MEQCLLYTIARSGKGTVAMINEYWRRFEETGCIYDYMDYARVKEEKMDKEGVMQNESGNSDRNGVVSNANWGI